MSIFIDPQISLVPLSLDDVTHIHSQVINNKEWLASQLYWASDIHLVSDTYAYVEQRVNSQLPNNRWFSISLNNQFAGVFAVKSVDEQGVAELGYWLVKSATRQQVINRVIEGVKQGLFKELGVTQLLFHCTTDNVASQKVAQKAGAIDRVMTNTVTVLNGTRQPLLAFRGTI